MKRFKGCLGVFLIFFFGVLFGAAITEAGFNKRMVKLLRGGPEEITDGTVRWLRKELKLDKDQVVMLKQIAVDTRIKLRKIRQTTQPEVDRTLLEAADRTRGILNPEQVKKFDEIIRKGHSEVEKLRTRDDGGPSRGLQNPSTATPSS